jgi:Right handed beta helix region
MTSRPAAPPLATALAAIAAIACGYPPSAGASEAAHVIAGIETATSSHTAALSRAVPCTRYAAPGGRDGNRGTKRSPFRTAQRLANSLRPGQTGCLRAGTYRDADTYVLRMRRGGVRDAPVTIRSYPGERATLVGIVHVPRGSNYVRLSRLTIRGTGGSNTVKIYAHRVIVQKSTITNWGRGDSCMILGSNDGYGRATRVVVRSNRFHNCGSLAHDNKDHGIYAQNVANGQIVGNVFWNSAGRAIQLYPNAQQTRFAHNVVDGGPPSVRGGVLFGGDSQHASNNNVVEYNVVAYAVTDNITSNWEDGLVGTGNIARRNCVWNAGNDNIDRDEGGFVPQANTVANPMFVSRLTRDYRLRSESECRDVVGFDAAARIQAPATVEPVPR